MLFYRGDPHGSRQTETAGAGSAHEGPGRGHRAGAGERFRMRAGHAPIAGVRGAMAGLMAEVVEDHVRTHLVDPELHPGALKPEAAEQLLAVIRSYLK